MNIKIMSDSTLLAKTDELVKRERELLSEILHHLREIERRRLFSQLGFKSLFDYATKRLGYGEDQAARRISAMRLLREIPELEEKINSGALTLTNLNLAQTLFRQEQKRDSSKGFNKEQKLELLAQIENKSKREVEKIVVSRSSEPKLLVPDRIRPVSDDTIEVRFMADSRLQQKLERVKGLLAQSHPNLSMAEAIDILCEMAIKKLDPATRQNRSETAQGRSRMAPAPDIKHRITTYARRAVWQKAQSRCEKCGSTHALQVDHIHPKALGGDNDLKNLRLLMSFLQPT